ncbi:unnamed protein product [Prorocentrum cordatum]|uniref:Uncharacterized protein n=1 Tax=Prorocentrum cordatum TaxID=2364126 RepID=A0ABN9TAY7_9DINO|nr:unnamed protein product [Polarella glacialis]
MAGERRETSRGRRQSDRRERGGEREGGGGSSRQLQHAAAWRAAAPPNGAGAAAMCAAAVPRPGPRRTPSPASSRRAPGAGAPAAAEPAAGDGRPGRWAARARARRAHDAPGAAAAQPAHGLPAALRQAARSGSPAARRRAVSPGGAGCAPAAQSGSALGAAPATARSAPVTARPGSRGGLKAQARPAPGAPAAGRDGCSRPASGRRVRLPHSGWSYRDQALTTVAGLWDLLRSSWSHRILDMAILFADLKDTGVDAALREAVPMRIGGAEGAEDLSPGEVAHLSAWLLDNPELEEELVRERLRPVRDACRQVGQFRRELHKCTWGIDLDAKLNARVFQRLLDTIALLTRIDLEYLVSHAAWLKCRQFEMTDTLVALVMERCAAKGQRPAKPAMAGRPERQMRAKLAAPAAADARWSRLVDEGGADASGQVVQDPFPDLALVSEPFVLADFITMCRSGALTDPRRKEGLSTEELQLLFLHLHRRVPELFRSRAEVRGDRTLSTGWATRVKSGSESACLVGRTMFEELVSELARSPPLVYMFPSPLKMVVHMLKSVAAHYALDEPPRQAAT